MEQPISQVRPSQLTGRRAIATATAVSIVLAYTTISGDLLAPLVHVRPIRDVPYLGSALVSLGDALCMVLLIALAAGRSPLTVVAQAGLQSPILPPLRWALLWLIPAIAASFAFARLAADVTASDIAWLGIGGPAVEEFVYRGLALGVLIRWCRWPMWLACVWPAVFFGLAHFGQGEDWMSVAGIVAITGVSGLLLGWLFVRWRINLWPPLLFHMGVNTIWTVFALGETALGGWFGNVMRLGVVAIAVATSFWLAPAKPRP